MASILNLNGRWRALVRKRGVKRCATFDSREEAQNWAYAIESEVKRINRADVLLEDLRAVPDEAPSDAVEPDQSTTLPHEPLEDDPGETELYRHFDAAGRLLYVGISLSAVGRLRGHRQESHWFPQIVRVEIERYATHFAAAFAERLAIREEKPLYNKHHVHKVDEPDNDMPEIADLKDWTRNFIRSQLIRPESSA